MGRPVFVCRNRNRGRLAGFRSDRRFYRKINRMYGTSRTFRNAFAAQFALVEIYVSQIVLYGNGTERTGFCAFSATDAGNLAGLLRHSALVLVGAGDINPAALLRTFETKLKYVLGTFADTGAAGGTQFLVHLRKTCFGIHSDGPELADPFAIAAAETAETACRLPGIKGADNLARNITVIRSGLFAVAATAVASEHGNHRSLFAGLETKYSGHGLHYLVPAYRTEMTVQARSPYAGLRKRMAAGMPATSAVRSRKKRLYLIHARVFLNLELGSHEIQDQSQNGS